MLGAVDEIANPVDHVCGIEHLGRQSPTRILAHHHEVQAAAGVSRIGNEPEVVVDDGFVDRERRDLYQLEIRVGEEERGADAVVGVYLRLGFFG